MPGAPHPGPTIAPVTVPEATPAMDPYLRTAAIEARGFMPTDEGDALWVAAHEASVAVPDLPYLEVGS